MKKAILFLTLATLFTMGKAGHARNQYLGMDVIMQEVYTGNASTPPATGTLSTKVVGSTINVTGITTYKNVVVDSGTIAISNQNPNVFITSGSVSVNNQNPNVFVTSGAISVDNLNPSYKNVVIDSGTITVNTEPNIWVTSGNIIVDNLNPSYKDIVVSSGNIINDDIRYSGKISSGTAGIITGATSATITISDKVCNYSFIMKNSADIGQFVNITNSIMEGADYLADGDYINNDIVIPAAITFQLNSLPASCTIQYHINTIK